MLKPAEEAMQTQCASSNALTPQTHLCVSAFLLVHSPIVTIAQRALPAFYSAIATPQSYLARSIVVRFGSVRRRPRVSLRMHRRRRRRRRRVSRQLRFSRTRIVHRRVLLRHQTHSGHHHHPRHTSGHHHSGRHPHHGCRLLRSTTSSRGRRRRCRHRRSQLQLLLIHCLPVSRHCHRVHSRHRRAHLCAISDSICGHAR
mmetsp:Transcript_2598/g.7058  ORF Transcript_2598/g.7058 Transcript_2598/m.7058 type:complete len:200 (+) Transcript_2598:217-816(+)